MNNLTTKNFFTTFKLHEEITTHTFTKTGVNPYIQQYKYLYIIHKIIADKSFHKGDYIGCKMNTKNLTVLFGNKHAQTCAIIKDLESWGLICKTTKAIVGTDAARYALTDNFNANHIAIISVEISDAGFVKKLIDYDKIESNKTVKQLGVNIYNISLTTYCYSYLYNKYKFLHTIDGAVDSKVALKVSKTMISDDKKPKFLLGGVEIDIVDLPLIQIHLKDFNTSRPDEKSRVYNNLTNLKREYRQYILFNGKPLLMTDISNSQVLLSVAAVKKQYRITSGIGILGLPDDIKHYQQLAESGKFYEYLIDKVTYTGDRNKFKKDFFKDVFFSKVTKAWTTPIKDAFIQEFPNIYALINQLKAKDYRDFAVSMQKLEASIMIDTVAKKMVKAGKCILTLHDAIVTDNEEDLLLAEELISDAMVKYGISPKFNREAGDKYAALVVNDETYMEELDTLTLIVDNKEVHFMNYTLIKPHFSDLQFRRRFLIAPNFDEQYVKYDGVVYKFNKCELENEIMIHLVA